jgi:hypothetical protein
MAVKKNLPILDDFPLHYSQLLFTPSLRQTFLVSKTVVNVHPSLIMGDKSLFLYKRVGKVIGFLSIV